MTRPLFIFEMANNHMGDVAHGVALIYAMQAACADFDAFEFAFKLQYRALDTFIHDSYKGREDVKYVKRFEETRLTSQQFQTLLDAMRACGFSTVCTPFDEDSVDLIEAQGIEMIKIASCSLTDWPLLERIARCDKPIIASTAGAAPEEVDNVTSFFLHRNKQLTLMHCVAEYPTPDERLHIARIAALVQRYPQGIARLHTWAISPNRWMRRSAAVALIPSVRKGLHITDALAIADVLFYDTEDLVQKGYGWLLKEASNVQQEKVFRYVMKRKKDMPRTALRYAIEKMPQQKRAAALAK